MNLRSTNVANNSPGIDTQPIPHRSVSQHFFVGSAQQSPRNRRGPWHFLWRQLGRLSLSSFWGGHLEFHGFLELGSISGSKWVDEHTCLWLELYNIMCIYMYTYDNICRYVCVFVNHVCIYIYTHIVYIYINLYIPYTYTVHTATMPQNHCYKTVQLCPKPQKSSSKLTLSTAVSLASLEMCRLYTCWDTSLICSRVRTLDLICSAIVQHV